MWVWCCALTRRGVYSNTFKSGIRLPKRRLVPDGECGDDAAQPN